MRALWLIIPAVVFAGCNFGLKTCSVDADCSEIAGATCDTTSGFCVAGDGGTGGGGGSATGGGNPTGGGMTTGGGGGGATGGGGGSTGGGGGSTCVVEQCPNVGDECVNDACAQAGLVITQVGTPPTVGLIPTTLRGLVSRADGGVADVRLPSGIRLTAPSDVFASNLAPPVAADGTFSLDVVSLDGGSDGPREIQATFDVAVGVVSGTLSLNRDRTPPALRLADTYELNGKRDDVFVLSLDSNEAVASAPSVTLQSVSAPLAPGACSGDAGCWSLDLSAPPLDALSGTFAVSVTATDLFGNSKTSALPDIAVSRIRWNIQAVPNTDTTRAAPALGADGTIFVGSANGAFNLGTLASFEPDAGATRQSTTFGAVVGLATATSNDNGGGRSEILYFTANDVQGRLGGLRASDLSNSNTVVQSPATGAGLSTTNSAPALAVAGMEVLAVGQFNKPGVGASRVGVFSPASPATGTSAPDGGATFDMSVDTQSFDVANNLIVDGTLAYFVSRPNGQGAFAVRIANVNTTPTLTNSFTLAAAGSGAGTSAQAWVTGEALVGGNTTLNSIYRLSSTLSSGDLGVPVDNGPSVVLDNSTAFVGRGNNLVRYNPQMLGSGGTSLGTFTLRTSPVLGAPRPSSSGPGLGYAIDTSGSLWVFALDGNADSAVNYGSVFGASTVVRAHPTLDCNRRVGSATQKTGVLYVASNSGRLAAVIVDSPKLNATPGSWPKYQRTAGNAGNTDNSVFPLNPGCP